MFSYKSLIALISFLVSVISTNASATGNRIVLDCQSQMGDNVSLSWYQRATNIAFQKEFISIDASVQGVGYHASTYFELVNQSENEHQLVLTTVGDHLVLEQHTPLIKLVFTKDAFPIDPNQYVHTTVLFVGELKRIRGINESIVASSILSCEARGRNQTLNF